MKTALKIVGALVLVLVLLGAGGFGWAASKRNSMLSRQIDVHSVSFPIPFPADASTLPAGVGMEEAEALSLEQARERGRHLVETRYACVECHGRNFGGGVMVDDPMIGRLLGPNITTGEGSVTRDYTPTDWDRIVRHGVKPDGTPAAMPSEDFARMSDQELSDVIVYIRSQPPVDNTVPAPEMGPLGTVLLATGQIPLSADRIEHAAGHTALPPATEPTAEFGAHLVGVCTGCHGSALAGGPIPGGDPSWVPAANLTPHADGLGSWTYEQFTTTLRTGTRPDGSSLRAPMDMVVQYTAGMTEVETQALWAYLQSVAPAPGN